MTIGRVRIGGRSVRSRGRVGLGAALLTLGSVGAFATSCGAEPPSPSSTGEHTEPFVASSWSSFTGGVTSVAVTKAPSGLDLWGVSNDKLRKATYVSGVFSGWSDVPDPNPIPGGIRDGVTAVEYSGSVRLIVKDDVTKKVWWRTWTRATNTYSSWAQVGASAGFANGSPVATVSEFAPEPSRLFVWIRATSGNLSMASYSPVTATWSAWSDSMGAPPGGFTNTPAALAIAGPTMFSYQHELAVMASDGTLWRRAYGSTGPLDTWESIGTGFMGSPVFVRPPGGGIELFATSTAGGFFFRRGYTRASGRALDWVDWVRLFAQPSNGWLPGVFPSFAAIYPSGSYAGGLEIFRIGTDNVTRRRSLTPGKTTETSISPSEEVHWEDTMAAIGPGDQDCASAGYPDGAVFQSVGSTGDPLTVHRFDAKCIRDGDSLCARDTRSFPWPGHSTLVAEGMDAGSVRRPEAADNLLVADPFGGLTLVRQSTAAIPDPQDPENRDKETYFRGTQSVWRSGDCGQTWAFRAFIDAKNLYDGRYVRRTGGCTGFDRPELIYNYANDRWYLTANACGEGGAAQVLLSAPRNADTWTPIAPPGSESPFTRTSGVLTAARDGTVFLLGPSDGIPMLEAYDPNTGQFYVQTRIPGVNACQGCESLVPADNATPFIIGSYGIGYAGEAANGDALLRLAFPRVSLGRQVERVMVVQVHKETTTPSCSQPQCAVHTDALTVTVLSDQYLIASSALGSLLSFTMIEADPNAFGDGVPTHLLYWDETTRTTNPQVSRDSGRAWAKARIVRGADPVDTDSWLTLSSVWPPGNWAAYTPPGDYRRGGFFANATDGVVFFPQWSTYTTRTDVPYSFYPPARPRVSAIRVAP